MQSIQTISENTIYVGASDRRLAKFENLFPIPRGVSYNAYVILDEKTALLDTADASVGAQFLENVAAALDGRKLDYLIVDHMEPDHAAMIEAVLVRWPDLRLVVNAKTLPMLKMYFPTDSAAIDDALVVKEGDTLDLGKHKLTFVMAPMVHWPEVMMTFDTTTGTLFSADAFGTFGALEGALFADEVDFAGKWLDDARRYYTNIVGKYGVQVQAVLKKAAGLDIETVCSLHGPILHKEQLADVLAAYDTWSAYRPETDGVLVAYTSIYGHTADAAEQLAEELRTKGQQVVVMDLARCDMAEAVAQAFRFSKLVLATPTYNGDVFPFTKTFIEHLTERNYQSRTVALMENGSWAPTAARVMRKMFETSKNLTILDEIVTIKGSLDAASTAQLHALADALSK